MKKPDTILDEIHAIRERIEERTKGMTPSERTAYFNGRGEIAAKKYGFAISPCSQYEVGESKANRLVGQRATSVL
jgi:hypothetical protein